MNDTGMNFSGKDLGPLPFESLFSVLIRHAWRNRIRFVEMVSIFKVVGAKRFSRSLYSKFWNELHLIPPEFCWEVHDFGQRLADALSGLEDIFASKYLRICPLCFEEGYHSPIFQVLSLPTCPIHSVLLTETCCSCGKKLPQYKFSRELFDQPYICHSCGDYIAGTEIRIQNHLEFRPHFAEIFSRMAPYETWLDNFTSFKPIFSEPVLDLDGLRRLGIAADAEHKTLSLIHNLAPFPGATPLAAKSLGILTWKLKPTFLRNTMAPGAHDRLRGQTAKLVYVTTLRMIKKWLIASGHVSHDSEVLFDGRNPVSLAGWDAYQVAYLLMRNLLEMRNGASMRSSLTYGSVTFKHRNDHKLLSFQGREMKLQWRALLISYYAYLYGVVCEEWEQGVFNVKMPLYNIYNANYSGSFFDGDKNHVGYVIFEHIDGMPLFPFDTKIDYRENLRRMVNARETWMADEDFFVRAR